MRKCASLVIVVYHLVAFPTIFAIYCRLMSIGKIKCTILFVLVCLVIALAEILGGLRSKARDAILRHVHDTCWRSIQISRTKMQGWRAMIINLELLTRFGKQETGCAKGIESYTKGILHLLGQGYEIEKDKLIQLWIAAGYMESEPMERHGDNYFEKLVSEGYLIPSDSNLVYKVNSNKVNSDLDKMRGKSSYLRLESTSQRYAATADILHVSVVSNGINDKMFKALGKFKRLRTLLFLCSCSSRIEQVPLDLFLSFESLVTLDLSRTNIKELPSSALKMIHLRYLDLSWTLIELLPEAIRRFQRLQTLKLRGCYHLWRLPREMTRLAELRHLDFDVLGQLSVMPKGMGVLVKLRSLSAFIVDSQEGFKVGELRDLNNLMGEFCIARLEHVQSAHDAKMASLSAKKHLKKLELRWSDFTLQEEMKNEHVLQNLCPPSDLEELQIQCYGGFHFPSWIGDESFHKLAGITLFKCEHVLMLPALQKLPSLEYLGLISLNCVKEMDVRRCELDRVAFPNLQRLIIDEMLNLSTWLEGEKGDFPCLVELTIKHCPQLPGLPSLVYLASLKRLEISSYPKAQFTDDKQLSASLEYLIIENCPLIKEFCDKIKHVQNVWIDQEAVMDRTVTDDDDDDDDDDDGSELINEEIEDDDDCSKEEAKIWSEMKQVQNVRIDQDTILDSTDEDDDDDDGPDQQSVIKESCFKEETRGDCEWDEIKPAVDFLALEQILNLDAVVDKDYRNTDEDETLHSFPRKKDETFYNHKIDWLDLHSFPRKKDETVYHHTIHWLDLHSFPRKKDETVYDHTLHWSNFLGLAGAGLTPSVYESAATGTLSERFNFAGAAPPEELHPQISESAAPDMQLFLTDPQPRSPTPPPHYQHHQPPLPPSTHMLLPGQGFHAISGHQSQFTSMPDAEGSGGGIVGGQGLSLSLSSTLEAAKAEEELSIGGGGMKFFGNQEVLGGGGASSNTSFKNLGVQQQHTQNQNVMQLQGYDIGMGMINVLRNSKYSRLAQELLEEFCSVNKLSRNNSTATARTSGGRAGHSSATDSTKELPTLSAADRMEHQKRKVKLIAMLDEVERRYSQYCEQMQMVVDSYDLVMGFGAAIPYTALAQKAMSRHFRCLKDVIQEQLKRSCELLGDKDVTGSTGITKGETPRLKMLEESLRQQRATHQMGMMEQEAWRPQRGLPERSVNILRAWLFQHFLHPYPSVADKHLLARQTGLSRNQVSNWFINARVHLWKPMVEEMYQQESKDDDDQDQDQDQEENEGKNSTSTDYSEED